METPSLRQRWLGAKLAHLRQQAGFHSLAATAEAVGRSTASLSRIENGVVSIPPRDLPPILDVYGVADQVLRDKLMVIAAEIQQERRGWWVSHGDALSPSYVDLIRLEATASEIWTYETHVVPGLFQTETYARATATSSWIPDKPAELDDFVAVRMNRKAIVSREDPTRLRAIVSEGVLCNHIGGAEVFREQLREMREQASRPNVTVQVLPFTQEAHPGVTGGFTVLRLASLDLVHIELMSSDVYVEDEVSVDRYLHAFEQLSSLALSPDASDALIADLADRL